MLAQRSLKAESYPDLFFGRFLAVICFQALLLSTMNSHTPFRNAHWRTPAIILAAFTAGLAFAVGHHCFYDYLDTITWMENLLETIFSLSKSTLPLALRLRFLFAPLSSLPLVLFTGSFSGKD